MRANRTCVQLLEDRVIKRQRPEDARLEREVALKLLPTGTLADESARKRFRKEARREALALSKLNHPNIETVHDFDTHEGADFLVMEHIPGETLDAKLAAGALLPGSPDHRRRRSSAITPLPACA